MDFHILGPLEAREDARPVTLTGGKQKALLAVLLLHAGRVVPVDRLVDDLWGEEVPETAQKMVQIFVSQLRKQLPDGLLQTRAPGYLVALDTHSLDLLRFEELAAEGRKALERGRAEEAAMRLSEALALWRGPALGEFEEPFAHLESARLEEQRLACLEERIEADLALARHAELVGELDALVRRHPHRERLRRQLMLALYRCGRHAEALEAFQSFRRKLQDELGIDPPLGLESSSGWCCSRTDRSTSSRQSRRPVWRTRRRRSPSLCARHAAARRAAPSSTSWEPSPGASCRSCSGRCCVRIPCSTRRAVAAPAPRARNPRSRGRS